MKRIIGCIFFVLITTQGVCAQKQIDSQLLYNPSETLIKLNELGSMSLVATVEKISLFQNDNEFSIFQNETQRKLYDFRIEGFDIKAVLSPDGCTALFFSKKDSKGDYENGVRLDINDGKITTYKLPNKYPNFDDERQTSYYSGQNRLYVNSENELWSIDQSTFIASSITKFNLPEDSYEDVLFLNNNLVYLRVTADNDYGQHAERFAEREIIGVYTFNLLSKTIEQINLENLPLGVFPLSGKRILLDYPDSYTIINTANDTVKSIDKEEDYRIYNALVTETTSVLVTGTKNMKKAFDQANDGEKFMSLFEIYDSGEATLIGTDLPHSYYWNPSEGYFIYDRTIIIGTSFRRVYSYYLDEGRIFKWDLFSSRSELSLYEGLTLSNDGYFTYHNGVNYTTLHLDPSQQEFWPEPHPDLLLKSRMFLRDETVLTAYQAAQKNDIGALLMLQDKKGKVIWESQFIKFRYREDIIINIFLSPNQKIAKVAVSTLEFSITKKDYKYFLDLNTKEFIPIKVESAFNLGTSFSYYNESNGYTSSHIAHLYPISGTSEVTLKNTAILAVLEDDNALLLDTNNQQKFTLASFDGEKFNKQFTFSNPTKSNFNERICPFTYMDDKKLIAAVVNDNQLRFWELDKKNAIKELTLSNSNAVHLTYAGDRLLVYFSNGYIDVIDLNLFEIISSLALHQDENSLSTAYFGNSLNFYVPKDIIDEYHFVKDGKALPLSSYELFLNRPGLYIEALGYASQETTNVYKEVYKKRLTRKGLSEKTNYLDIERPQLTVINENNKLVTDEKFEFDYRIENPLQSLIVYNNGVPVFEQTQIDMGNHHVKTLLSDGGNKIILIGTNTEGIETEPKTIEVELDKTTKDKKVYYLGVGVSKYKDSTWNLRYADIDVKSIKRQLEKRYAANFIVETLLNEEVTKENLKRLKDTLLQSSINDMVIISFSGHGTIDNTNNFYFATHDIDFDDPAARGFSYQDIEWLLTDIPARRKLLLIDACHSGELEEGEILEVSKLPNENVSSFSPKGSKVIKSKKKSGLQNSFELMQSLFYDTDRGNGSVVISAAGGKEFAFESDVWNNGVFTYSFLKALDNLSIEEGENDGVISISELKRYIYNSVLKLTNGQQKPTARAENIEWDWELLSN